jgi:hypothetical protein
MAATDLQAAAALVHQGIGPLLYHFSMYIAIILTYTLLS